MSTSNPPTTALCRYTDTQVFYREKDLVKELLPSGGDFVSVMMEHIFGRPIPPAHVRVMNAALIVLMEHGLTPSAIATREVYMSAPENLQGAVAAGLMAVGSQFVGTMENTAVLLEELVVLDGEARRARAAGIVAEHRARRQHLPGFGHHLHRPDDPRALKLLEIGEAEGFDRGHLASLKLLAEEVDRVHGRHITINATGAIAALFGEMEIPVKLMRGFAVISRAAGLVAHVAEEQARPSGRHIWTIVDKAIPYEA